MMLFLFVLLLGASGVFSGLDAAWQALDPIRLRHRADKGNRRALQMMAWERVRPQADLVLAWTGNMLAVGALAVLAAEVSSRAGGRFWWMVPLVFLPAYALFAQLLPRQIFRRLPFAVLSSSWWLVTLSGSLWSPLARPVAGLLRKVRSDALPRPPVAEEIMVLASKFECVSPLELSMLRSVLEFRGLTAGSLALAPGDFPEVPADRLLGEMLFDRKLAEARHTIVMGADGMPLGVMSCGAAALSGAMSARAQSFARPMLSFPSGLPAWRALASLRRSPTPVAEVRDEVSGRLVGILTDQSVVARLLGLAV